MRRAEDTWEQRTALVGMDRQRRGKRLESAGRDAAGHGRQWLTVRLALAVPLDHVKILSSSYFRLLFFRTPTLERSMGLKPSLSAGDAFLSRKSYFCGATNTGSAMIEPSS
jgi:hypothetical protein